MKSLRALAALAVASPLLVGCGSASGSDEKPNVVTSFYALEYVAQRIVGEHATVTNLTHPGTEPHDLELSVPQTAEVVDADLVFYEKGFQPAVDRAVEQNGPEHVVDAAASADLLPAEEGDDDGELDPHFWLDPARLGSVAQAFEKELAAADPAHAPDYAKNLSALEAELTSLDMDFRTGLANCKIDTIVVSHDAFGYLGAAYELQMAPINGLSPDAEPSPAHIKALHDLIDSDGITTVFSETLASPEMANTLAGDLGILAAVLDPIEGLSDATKDEDYVSLMRKNLAALQEANQCS